LKKLSGAALTQRAGRQLSFRVTLETWAEGMDYCAVAVPARISKALGTRGPVQVMARVNGSEPFQVSLFPVGGGQHCIRIKAKIRRETMTRAGDLIQVRMTVLDRTAVEIPEDLVMALRVTGLSQIFDAMPAGRRNSTIRRINEAVKPETRAKRILEALCHARRVQK
jgi:hypothetical protein